MARYVLENAAGEVVNIIEWDGASPYEPEEGLRVRPASANDAIPNPPEPEDE